MPVLPRTPVSSCTRMTSRTAVVYSVHRRKSASMGYLNRQQDRSNTRSLKPTLSSSPSWVVPPDDRYLVAGRV